VIGNRQLDRLYRIWYTGPAEEAGTMSINEKHVGGSLDDFLKEEGIYEEVCCRAAKKALALQFQAEMKKKRLSKLAMSRRMHTSRSSLDRLLDPDNGAVELKTISKAAAVLGKRLKVQLV
jgi:hypothetical protein